MSRFGWNARIATSFKVCFGGANLVSLGNTANIKCISWRNMKVCVWEHEHMDCFFVPISHSATRLACELVLFRLCSLCTSLNLWMSLIFLFLSKNHLSPVLYLCISSSTTSSDWTKCIIFFLSVCQLEEKARKETNQCRTLQWNSVRIGWASPLISIP